MDFKEKLRPNTPEPTLFVGLGGRGSDVINGIAELAKNDSLENVRFVILDTDVNDLTHNKDSRISGVQTSSTKTVKAYLTDDKKANKWFPSNETINRKTVSEGAGQVRAISRLALNATIKEGKISVLYKAIDDLYLKNGNDKKQAIKVIIASTAAGGTGSGIAMIVGMLIKRYLQNKYPESSAIVRGFLLLPGVCQAFDPAQSEVASLQSNGYATIKEINAFMMKGGGYFDNDSELLRYKNLHVSIPSATYGTEKLDNLPFDFCFLMDRTDAEQGNMDSMKQYVSQAARAIYEQTIGPMSGTASSKEDNIHKVFIDPEKRGRSRFGGAGASALVYPYESIVRYIAITKAQEAILGIKAEKGLSEKEQKELLSSSWRAYDARFSDDFRKWVEENFGIGEEPTIEKKYIEYIQDGTDVFTTSLRQKFLDKKLKSITVEEEMEEELDESSDDGAKAEQTIGLMLEEDDDDAELRSPYDRIIDNYMSKVIDTVVKKLLSTEGIDDEFLYRFHSKPSKENVQSRFNDIKTLQDILTNGSIASVAENFAKSILSNNDNFVVASKIPTSIENLVSINGKAVHPIIARYLLYKLKVYASNSCKTEINIESYIQDIEKIISDTSRDKKKFEVGGNLGKESTLEQMCGVITKSGGIVDISSKAYNNCVKYLRQYYSKVNESISEIIIYNVSKIIVKNIEPLIKQYEDFFDSLESRIPDIDKKKLTIAEDIHFERGDSVIKLFGNDRRYGEEEIPESKVMLDELCAYLKGSAMKDEDKLYQCIHNAIKKTSFLELRAQYGFDDIEVEDVFDDIILEFFVESVAKSYKDTLDKPVLQMLLLERKIVDKIQNTKTRPIDYVINRLKKAETLAAPGISKNNFDERREVNAVACSDKQIDGEGIKVKKILGDDCKKSDTISKYEIRFFKSIYDVMPTQLSMFCYPSTIDNVEEMIESIDNATGDGVGEYFRSYQEYMKTVRSNCELNSAITPHIDRRWNSISVMPEIDLDFQKALMSHIHQAMFYGFVYRRIKKFVVSTKANLEMYKYISSEDDKQELYVSNGTACDQFYEVLDALYFDRAAVTAIHKYAKEMRDDISKDGVPYEKTEFALQLPNLTRKSLMGEIKVNSETEQKDVETSAMSVFEIPVLYYNTLPADLRDSAEIRIMAKAIIQVFKTEIKKVTPEYDVMPTLAEIIIQQFNLLVDNYNKYPEFLGRNIAIANNDVVDDIYRIVRKEVKGYEGNNTLKSID